MLIHDFSARLATGEERRFADYRGKVLLIVNVETAESMARIDRQSLHGLGQGNAGHRRLPNQHRS
jgi:glutathione peroxidase-family protein